MWDETVPEWQTKRIGNSRFSTNINDNDERTLARGIEEFKAKQYLDTSLYVGNLLCTLVRVILKGLIDQQVKELARLFSPNRVELRCA